MPKSRAANESEPKKRRDARPLIYGALDLVFAGSYALFFSLVAPNRFAGYSLLLWALVFVLAAVGIATLTRHPRGCAGRDDPRRRRTAVAGERRIADPTRATVAGLRFGRGGGCDHRPVP